MTHPFFDKERDEVMKADSRDSPPTRKGISHELYEREDELAHCKICRGAEGTLPTDCPCYPIPEPMRQLVWDGKIDFIVDKWVSK